MLTAITEVNAFTKFLPIFVQSKMRSGFIKKQRLNWLGQIERMVEDNIMQRIKRWKPMSKRPIGRRKTCWEGDVLEYIKNMNLRNWKKAAQTRDSWKTAVEQARTLYRL
jgi:hypothetical protein